MKNRELYINQLMEWKEKKIIKVITGMRRTGKSTILNLFRENLINMGVSAENTIQINFEDLKHEELQDYKILYDYILEKIKNNYTYYIFLDEIQLVPQFEKAINGLFLNDNLDIYLTGSNANLLSSEIATLLTGRYIEIKMYPLSYKEYSNFTNSNKSDDQTFMNYLKFGGMPYTTELHLQQKNTYDYLKGIFDTVVVKDIVIRNKLKDVQTLYSVINFLFDNIGNSTSINKISNTLSSNGKKTNPVTIDNYVRYLIDSYIIYQIKRYDIKGKEFLKTQGKYYIADIGLRNAVLGLRNIDQGFILENLVFLELKRRGYEVAIGKIGDLEVDFIATNDTEKMYIQVAHTIMSDSTLNRELKSLKRINDNYPKLLITQDKVLNEDFQGIKHINVIDFLTSDKIL
jgi:predicted AAA+ superfamily ATPase